MRQAAPRADRRPARRLRGRLRRARRRAARTPMPGPRPRRCATGRCHRSSASGARAWSAPPAAGRCVRWTCFSTRWAPPPDGFVVTLPKVSAVEQVEAMTVLCEALEAAHGCRPGGCGSRCRWRRRRRCSRPDGTATVARTDPGRGRSAEPGCTSARTTTAPRAGSPPGIRAWNTRPRITPRR